MDVKMNEVATTTENSIVSPSAIISSVVESTSSDEVNRLLPLNYLINEQAKSFVALQELQNEVGALLQFRDMVIEMFPHLRQKILISTDTLSSLQLQNLSTASGGKWLPGVRVKRKLGHHSRDQDDNVLVSSLLPQNNNHSKPSSRSGDSTSLATSSAIQDSGFCPESKEHSSSSSTTRKTKGSDYEDDDEESDNDLLSILDTIYHRGLYLKIEVENLRSSLPVEHNCQKKDIKWKWRSCDDLLFSGNESKHGAICECTTRTMVLEAELNSLKEERTNLQNRINDMEIKHSAALTQINNFISEIQNANTEQGDVDEKLRTLISKFELKLDADMQDLDSRSNMKHCNDNMPRHFPKPYFILKRIPAKNTSSQASVTLPRSDTSGFTPVGFTNVVYEVESAVTNEQNRHFLNSIANSNPKMLSSVDVDSYVTVEDSDHNLQKLTKISTNETKTKNEHAAVKTMEHNVLCSFSTGGSENYYSDGNVHDIYGKTWKQMHTKLGALDGLVSSPRYNMKVSKGSSVTKDKVAAILEEFNPLELQRHLLTCIYQKESLNVQAQRISRSKKNVILQLNKYREEIEDLKFQLEERNIQLEGTRAQMRVLEKMHHSKHNAFSDNISLVSKCTSSSQSESLRPSAVESSNTDSMKVTRSAGGQKSDLLSDNKHDNNSIYKKPSRIPLKVSPASKPPTGNSSSHTSIKEAVSNSSSWGKNKNDFLSRNWDSSKNNDLSITRVIPKNSSINRELHRVCESTDNEITKQQSLLTHNASYSSYNSPYAFLREKKPSTSRPYTPKKHQPISQAQVQDKSADSEPRTRASSKIATFLNNWIRISGPS